MSGEAILTIYSEAASADLPIKQTTPGDNTCTLSQENWTP